ncbi:MAG: PDP protein [Campylobacterales bacterium]|nr:PDP protein [Campylobacterales bacterium]
MKFLLLLIVMLSSLFSLQTSEKLFECTEIFKERKSELLVELERIDEQKQALDALKTATEELLKKREIQITQKEEGVNKKLADISQKEESIKSMLTKNEETLKEIKDLKMNNISQTFAKMKAASAAAILSDMNSTEAITILGSLQPKTVGQILTKMDAKKASELTAILNK